MDNIRIIGSEANFVDGQSYCWKVKAVDQYGAETPSEEWGFVVNNQNPLVGWIKGLVYDTATDQPISQAQVSSTTINIAVIGNGYYLGTGPTGIHMVTISADGYEPSSVSGVAIPEGGVTNRNFGWNPQ